LSGASRTGLVAWDFSGFNEQFKIFSKQTSVQSTKARQYKAPDIQMTTYGVTVKTEDLKTILDNITNMAATNNLPLTFKIVLRDVERLKKGQERAKNPYVPVEKENFYKFKQDLLRRLKKYKLAKNPTIDTPEELIKLIRQVDNATKTVTFGGYTYSFDNHGGSVNISDILKGHIFYSNYVPQDDSVYNSLKIGWQFDPRTGTLDPVAMEYAVKGEQKPTIAILNDEKYLDSYTDWNWRDKEEVIPVLLGMLKNTYIYYRLFPLIKTLKKVHPDWPELDTIEAAARKEIAK
jgi:hypothetical protein